MNWLKENQTFDFDVSDLVSQYLICLVKEDIEIFGSIITSKYIFVNFCISHAFLGVFDWQFLNYLEILDFQGSKNVFPFMQKNPLVNHARF